MVNTSEKIKNRWIITITVMLVTVIETLDMTIVNVSLPTIAGSLGANYDQMPWVITTYTITAAIIMPLTGFLVSIIGQKRLLLLNITGFLINSCLCGLSQNIIQLVIFRGLQGLFGASLVPLSQSIINQNFSADEKPKAMSIWGIGVMVGPVLGPSLGGYITDVLNWKYIFFINIPICLVALVLTRKFIEDTPRNKTAIDWLGIFFIVTGIGSLQIFLDRGNIDNWFDSNFILTIFVISIVSILFFVIHRITKPDKLVNISLFKNRQFFFCTLMVFVFSSGFFGVVVILPTMLENVANYSSITTGIFMASRGIAAIIGMLLVPKLIEKIDLPKIIIIGIILSSFSTYLMAQYNSMLSFEIMVIPTLILGVGSSFIFSPLIILSLGSLHPSQIAEGAGLFSFFRSLGLSMGMSISSTLMSRETSVNWQYFSQNNNLNQMILYGKNSIGNLHLDKKIILPYLNTLLKRESLMLAFTNVNYFITICFILMLPLMFIFLKKKNGKIV